MTLDDLTQLAEQCRQAGKTIALCHGTFDLLHIGHIKHLQKAARLADCLLVTVTADQHVNKGPGRPVFNQQLRMESIAALSCVTAVAVNDAETSVNVLERIRPDFYVKGSDYRNEQDDLSGNIRRERLSVEKYGGRLFFTDEPTASSSTLLNQHFNALSQDVTEYFKSFNANHAIDQVLTELDRLKQLRVLVVGEAIIDEYHYISSLGQTGKGNVLAVKYENQEKFAGGSIAVANHIAGFVQQVSLLTVLGGQDSQEDFIRQHLENSVQPHFFQAPDRQTIVKRRYVDGDINKLFEVYFYNEQDLPDFVQQQIIDWLEQQLSRFDVVVVADFGNGFISDAMVRVLTGHANYLAVNAQTNSGNRGYHFVTRYDKANFVSLNEPELHMTTRDRKSPIQDLAQQLAEQMDVDALAVTRGRKGALLVTNAPGKPVHQVPALTQSVVDRIGAGDAFLALAGTCLGGGLDAEIALLIGSIAAAIDVQIVCNRESVDPLALRKYLTTLMK